MKTREVRPETALTGAEPIYARAFRASGTILLISSLSTGCFLEVNEAFERTLGYRREEVVGRKTDRFHLWESPRDRAAYVQSLREQGEVRSLEVRLRSKSGTTVVGLLSGEVVDVGGDSCILTIINDITERKRAAEEIEVLHTELAAHALALEMANDELEAFTYTVSHDLRKPLTAISGYSQVLQEICLNGDDSQCRPLLFEILKGTARMNGLIDTLLEFSRLSNGALNKGPVDLSSVAADAVGELTAAAPRRRCEIRIQEGVTGEGDAVLLRVVVDNLIGNAWKYTANREGALIEFGCRDSDGRSAYFVRDNGIGFRQEGAATLFTPFHREAGSESFHGSGIGLATVSRIVKRHGGRVWAEGEPGKGATFYFTLG